LKKKGEVMLKNYRKKVLIKNILIIFMLFIFNGCEDVSKGFNQSYEKSFKTTFKATFIKTCSTDGKEAFCQCIIKGSETEGVFDKDSSEITSYFKEKKNIKHIITKYECKK
jgi:hypothetical protein